MREIWDPNICRHIWNQYHNQLCIYLELVPQPVGDTAPLEIMDVGCAQGTLALLLAERGHRVCAVDLRQKFLDYARSRYTHGDIEFIVGNALELNFERKFDVIFANQIIEHLVYPRELVGGLSALLKPGGILVVTTPSWHYIKNALPSFDEIGDPAQYEDRQFTADADGHFYAYRESELFNVFRREGFASIEVRFFETPIISGHMKLRYVHGVLPALLLRALDRALLATPLRRKMAHQLMLVGRKA
jgi:2-polyprenyl-3-methyl-5-hydroxy-6-metoxy-1,4-benzoquinol methylase